MTTTRIAPAEFEPVIEYIIPKPDEMRWMGVQWETDLWEARRLAEKLDKPIFLWAMNGHPLGCV